MKPETISLKKCRLTLNREGADQYTKISYPLKYGIYSELETPDAVLQFNLNNELIRARGKDKGWIHPSEWLKRSVGDDWIYYSTGGYAGVFEAIGEYYLPNFPYPTNSLIGGKPFNNPSVARITSSWHEMIKTAREALNGGISNRFESFLSDALFNTPDRLHEKADLLFETTGGRVSVLPPDARHVDYDVIPLTISEGCLYKCRFCRIKNERGFSLKSMGDIEKQLMDLKRIYGKDLINYSSIFLGEHDALNAGCDHILSAAKKAYEVLDFRHSYMREKNLFFFGSADSLMDAETRLFEGLNKLPFKTYINIGLESADQETLDRLGKPITSELVLQAFEKIHQINSSCNQIEITANFIMDDHLPEGHYPAFLKLVREKISRTKNKGSVYLSPLRIAKPSREILFKFNRLKTLSRVPTFLYIIQRL